MCKKEQRTLENHNFAAELADQLEHYRLPNGGYATDLVTAIFGLKDANAELAQLRNLSEEELSDEQKAMKEWATETIGKCNRIVLEHAEKYPHLFKEGVEMTANQ